MALSASSATLLTALAFRHGQAGRRGSRAQPAALIDDVGVAEEEGLPHLDDPTNSPRATVARGTDEVDLQLDRRVPGPVRLERRQRRAHRRVGDLGDHTALD